jgi:hypothetical protein
VNSEYRAFVAHFHICVNLLDIENPVEGRVGDEMDWASVHS